MLPRALGLVVLLGCRRGGAPIVAEDAHATAPAAAAPADAAAPDSSDASDPPEAGEGDACAQTETWDARVVVRKTWHATAHRILPGPLEVVVPSMHLRKTIFEDCGMTGGGCGDCAKPYDPMYVSCKLTPDRAEVYIGVDDVGPTFVDVVQRGDTLVAEWTEGGMVGLPTPPKPTHRTETLAKLPCSVKIRFVR